VVREPETAEGRCQKKSNFWRRILKKCTAEIPCVKKKTEPSVCGDETGRQKKKNCAKEKFCAPCIPHTAARKWQKNCFLAARVTQRLDTRAKGCAHGSSVGLWKKLCAQLLEATGQERKIGAPDTHAWRAGWAEAPKKKLRAPSREEVTGQRKKKFLHAQQLLTGQHKKNLCAQTRSDQTLHAHPEKRFCMHTPADRTSHKKLLARWQGGGEATKKNGARRPCWAAANNNNNNNNNNKAFLSQARWGRLEMKPRKKTSELNTQRTEKGNKGKGEPKTTKRGNT
jgi:hypothetical protein